MAYTPIYTPKNFSDWGPPDLDASNLNDIEAALVSLGNGLQTAAADTDTNTAAITTINGEISDINDLIDAILPNDSESGNPAVITDAFAGECKSLVLTLEPIQSGSGTPSPANPRPITGRTQSTVKRTGSNLCNPTLATNTQSGVTCTNNGDGTYTFNGTNSSSSSITFFIISSADYLANPALAGEMIKVCGCPAGGSQSSYRLRIVTSNWGGVVDDIGNGATFTLAQNVSRFYFEVAAGATCNNVILKPMLTLDTNASYGDFEQYDGESITEAYVQTLYGASVDVTGGEAVSTHKLVDLGSLSYVMYQIAEGTLFRGVINDIKLISSLFVANDNYCSAFPCVPTSQRTNYTASQNFNNHAIDIIDDDYSDPDAFKAAMSGVMLCYELETPVSIPITPQNLTLLKGDNVITTDADNVEVEYKADIALYIAKQLGGNLGNRGARSAPADEPADDPKEEEKSDEIIEPVTKEAKK